MIWLNPAAWIALVAVAAPILIHIFVQRKARPIAFPTLRFLQPTRLAAIRRHTLEDLPLLLVRAAILAAAVAAFAAPLVVRRQAWNTRITRAVVIDRDVASSSSLVSRDTSNQQPATAERTFDAASLGDGIRLARAWLETAPPARREIVIVSPLALGSVTAATLSSIPPEIGVRFERAGELPKERSVEGGEVLGPETVVIRRRVTLATDGTAVREAPGEPRAFPVDVIGAPSSRPAIEHAIAAVLARRVWAPPADRFATIALSGNADADVAIAKASPISQPWMADAVARIALDTDLEAVAARSVAALGDSRFTAPPWVVAVQSSNRKPLAAAASTGGRLLIASATDASSFLTPLLIRSVVNAMAEPPDLRGAEVLPIPDDQLRAWTRPPGPVTRLRNDSIGTDDRRWLWALVILLLGVESWVRRARRTANDEQRTPHGEPRTANGDEAPLRVA